MVEIPNNSRRGFIETGLKIAVISGIGSLGFLTACKDEDSDGQKVSPPEDLMQEHGILKRVLLIYDDCSTRLINMESLPIEALLNAAIIIKTFIEDYHEKQEEDYIFPRFQKANQLTGLVKTLLEQHKAGRNVTDEIIQLCKGSKRTGAENNRLVQLLLAFKNMYGPHEAREDTVLFPAFRKIVSRHEYDSLGEEFEKNEHKLFGKNGFETVVEKVANIEKILGIYDLEQFTPRL